jgi:hypothetical protein
MSFLQVTGHMHHRGMRYQAHATSASGEVRALYSSDTWDEPATLNLAPPFSVAKGDTIDYSCDFNNESATTLIYGESAEKNEMCNLFGVFYPAPGGNGIASGL